MKMKAAIWCRHKDDCIIGIGPNIPWHISSDFKRFKRVTKGKSIVAGQTTYESFPNRTLPNRKIYVMTFDADYQVSDKDNHFVVTNKKQLDVLLNEELYISGGASIYRLFMTDIETAPDVIVDCCYQGEIDASLTGQPVDVKSCVEFMEKNYLPYTSSITEDNVDVCLWVKNNTQISQIQIADIWKRIVEK